ncbi:hypothetical protein K461DRAFT_273459 [Myriangium duriaei CBS 260.36]|uniref:Uncharacterized protein n=1 Tax=Myriangium duriaei CBS 260.36 TaxID=1168546 RepID=A0A9P4MJM7_9PEZI|nr:hypothetical protein K461DRAFT_273459 [Myriangium duriaei CBS 260.36]
MAASLQTLFLLSMAIRSLAQSASATSANPTPSPSCVAYGVDFQSGQTYFQNASSTAPFTFVSEFEGCQADICQNVLVDPNGNQITCSNTTLTPDDTPEQSTCNIDKDQLTSGEWSILLLSNNGNAAPIAYQRDFSLTVGVPTTITVTPTITVGITTTVVQNVTSTSTTTLTTRVNSTTTIPSTTVVPTITVHPRTTIDVTKTLGTVSKTARTVIPSFVTETITATCTIPPRQPQPDPWCSITPTRVHALALQTPHHFQIRGAADRRAVPMSLEQMLQERKERLAASPGHLVRRGIDSATVTVTDTNTADCPTVTSTITASTSTLLITTIETDTITSTNTITDFEGATTAPCVTVTAPTKTWTHKHFTVITTIVATKTYNPTLTIRKTVTPKASATLCHAKGGHMTAPWW